MLLILLFTLTVIVLSILTSLRTIKYGLEITFFFIFVFCALRYDFGNDYKNYYEWYYDTCNHKNFGNFMQDFRNALEPGWAFLYLLTRPIGFFGFIVLSSAFTSYVFYKSIRQFVSVKWQWLAVTCYILNPYIFWIPLSMMRQSLAVVVFLALVRWIYNKKYILSFLALLCAITFHRSAIILLPFIFLGYLPINKGKWVVCLCLIALIVMFSSFTTLFEYITPYLMENENIVGYLIAYGGAKGGSFGLGAVISIMPFVVALYYFWHVTDRRIVHYLVILAMIHSILTPIGLFNGLMGRLDYYFNLFTIFAIPITFATIKTKAVQVSLLALYLSINLYGYWGFFHDPGWIPFHEYHTILFAN